MFDEGEGIKGKLIERVGDLDAARNRWIFAIIVFVLLFLVALGIYLAPISEESTKEPEQFIVDKDGWSDPVHIDLMAIPSTYEIHFEFELDKQSDDPHANAFIYIFKDEAPDISDDLLNEFKLQENVTSGAPLGRSEDPMHQYLKAKAFRAAEITVKTDFIEWDLAFRDCDTTDFYVMVYNPDDPDTDFDNMEVIVNMVTSYEPLMPIVPVFFIFAFLIVLPIAIIRIYVISQKKKELRVLLTLDLENLSDEDKVRLGIPVTSKPEPAPQQPPPQTQAPAVSPQMPQQVPRQPPQTGGAPSTPKDGYMTPDELK